MAYTSCLTGCRSASQNDSPAPSLHAKVKVLPILAENFPKTEINPPPPHPPPLCATPHENQSQSQIPREPPPPETTPPDSNLPQIPSNPISFTPLVTLKPYTLPQPKTRAIKWQNSPYLVTALPIPSLRLKFDKKRISGLFLEVS